MGNIFTRVKNLYQARGPIGLLRAGLAHLRIYEYYTFYIFKNKPPWTSVPYPPPKISDFTSKILTTTAQLEELINEGYDFVSRAQDIKNRLEKGAVGFIIFVEKELASMEWIATTEQAKQPIDWLPYKVDFANHEACNGDAWTNPKYRRQGLHSALDPVMHQYYDENGIKKTKSIIQANNIASLKSHAKNHPGEDQGPVAKLRHIKVCGLESWKETPVSTKDTSNYQNILKLNN